MTIGRITQLTCGARAKAGLSALFSRTYKTVPAARYLFTGIATAVAIDTIPVVALFAGIHNPVSTKWRGHGLAHTILTNFPRRALGKGGFSALLAGIVRSISAECDLLTAADIGAANLPLRTSEIGLTAFFSGVGDPVAAKRPLGLNFLLEGLQKLREESSLFGRERKECIGKFGVFLILFSVSERGEGGRKSP